MKEFDRVEVEGINLLIKRLETVKKSLVKSVDKKKTKRIEKVEKYKTIEEVQDAYGYDEITDKEYYELISLYENRQENIEGVDTKDSVALDYLQDFIKRLKADVIDLDIHIKREEEE
jgi:hypothetical protein